MFKEFREFITRGSVIPLAVGVIMGAAFTGIVTSLVNDMFMPLVGALIGGIHFEGLAFTIGEASINYGKFIHAVVNFILVAIVIFFLLRSIVAMEKKLGMELEEKDSVPEPDPEPSDEVKLLTEIRDLMIEGEKVLAGQARSKEAKADMALNLVIGKDQSVKINSSDCGSASGAYTVDGLNSINFDIDDSGITCDADSLTGQFVQYLNDAASWHFDNGGLIVELPMDGGTMVFKPVPLLGE